MADETAASDKNFDDDDIINYILNGLDADYNPFVSSMTVKDNLMLTDLYAPLLAYEAWLLQQRRAHLYSSVHMWLML